MISVFVSLPTFAGCVYLREVEALKIRLRWEVIHKKLVDPRGVNKLQSS